MANELTVQELDTAMNHMSDARSWAMILREGMIGGLKHSEQDKLAIRKSIMKELDAAHKRIFTDG